MPRGKRDYSNEEFHIGSIKDYEKTARKFEDLGDGFYYLWLKEELTGRSDSWIMMVDLDSEDLNVIAECCIDEFTNSGQISSFVVDSRYRRQGYGEKFLRYVIENYKMNTLMVFASNYPAIKLYKKSGFKEVSHIFIDREKFITMKLGVK